MARSWITPKTNWTKSDKVAYSDYNRIRNNLLYINDMLNEKYPDKAQTLDLGDALTYSANYLPSQFNAFENALESFTRVGNNVNIGDKKTFVGNSPFIDYNELNRIEACCLRWYNYDPVIHVSSIEISPKTQNITIGESKTFVVTCLPDNAEEKNDWVVRSSNTSVLTVSKSGDNVIATAVGVGNATISVSVYNSSATASVTVEGVLVTQIIPEKNSVDIPYLDEIDFGYTIIPSNATNVDELEITSSRPSVVGVRFNGMGNILLEGKTLGQANINFKCGQVSSVVAVNVLNVAYRVWTAIRRGGNAINAYEVYGGAGRTINIYVVTEPLNATDKYNFSYEITKNPQCIDVVKNGDDMLVITTRSVGTSTIKVDLNSGRGSWEVDIIVKA